MKVLSVGEFKTNFSSVLDLIRQGKSVSLGFGKSKDKLAVLVPYKNYKKIGKVKLGLLKNKAKFSTTKDFKLSDGQLLKA